MVYYVIMLSNWLIWIYNGKELNDSNYVNKVGYENLLRTIRSSAVGIKPFDAEEVLAAQYAFN